MIVLIPHSVKSKGPTMGIRTYKSAADRRRAIGNLRRHGWNYFVCYREGGQLPKDTGHLCALNYGVAQWVPEGQVHIDA